MGQWAKSFWPHWLVKEFVSLFLAPITLGWERMLMSELGSGLRPKNHRVRMSKNLGNATLIAQKNARLWPNCPRVFFPRWNFERTERRKSPAKMCLIASEIASDMVFQNSSQYLRAMLLFFYSIFTWENLTRRKKNPVGLLYWYSMTRKV